MLIKTIACVVPIYTMACIKFLIKICDDINSAIANFWWGQNEDERKVHWKSCISLTTCKSMRD